MRTEGKDGTARTTREVSCCVRCHLKQRMRRKEKMMKTVQSAFRGHKGQGRDCERAVFFFFLKGGKRYICLQQLFAPSHSSLFLILLSFFSSPVCKFEHLRSVIKGTQVQFYRCRYRHIHRHTHTHTHSIPHHSLHRAYTLEFLIRISCAHFHTRDIRKRKKQRR